MPGGHAPGMKPYLESAAVQDIARAAFAADKPVSAICHGVIPLARSGVLKGRKTTALNNKMEGLAVFLTRSSLGEHYRTYPERVEDEVRRLLASPDDFDAGPMIPRFASAAKPYAGFVVEDGNYISARWPGDAWTLAKRMLTRLG
jgi:protease I